MSIEQSKIKVYIFTGNYYCSEQFLQRIIPEFKDFDVRICAYGEHSRFLPQVDYLLDGLQTYNYYKEIQVPVKANPYWYNVILDELYTWQPDLIISYFDPISLSLAQELGMKCWVVSNLDFIKIFNIKYKYWLHHFDSLFIKVNSAERMICYSNLYKYSNLNLDWVQPYTVEKTIDNSGAFWINSKNRNDLTKFCRSFPEITINQELGDNTYTTGETGLMADCIEAGVNFATFPRIADPEGILNSSMWEHLGGLSGGQIERMGSYSMLKFQDFRELPIIQKLNIDNKPFLHELIKLG